MTVQEIAALFISSTKNNTKEIYDLYHEDIIGIENPSFPNEMMKYTERKGIAAKIESMKQWEEMIGEVHSDYIGEPIFAGDIFSVAMGMDLTYANGTRMKFDEIAIITTKDGKVVKEEYIY